MTDRRTISLSWPARPLWQNTRTKWRDKAKATRTARQEAWALALEAKVPTTPNAVLRFSFHPPDRRKRDIQNMPATMKAACDGIADAMGCDDAGFECVFPSRFCEVRKGGAVVVTVEAS